jgi:hypothetical protein
MMLFRSEEDARAWSDDAGRPLGAIVALDQLQRLATAWYGDRLQHDWQPRTREQSQAVLSGAGLTGDFWRLG